MRARPLTAFGALTYRDYRLLWSGQVISNVGASMAQLGLGWLIVQLAERDRVPELVPVYLGLVGLARGVTVVFAGLSAGVLADRVDRRRLLLGVQVYWAIVATILAALTLSGHITIELVIGLTVLSSVAQAFDGATRQSILTRLVPRSAIVSAIGLNSISFNVAQFIGPMIGGLLIPFVGVGGLMAANAMSFAALIAAILASRPLGGGEGGPVLSPLRSLHEGLQFVWHEPTVRWTMLLSVLGNLLARPFQLLLPAVVHDTLRGDATDLSWLMVAAGLGALCGAFGTASLGAIRRRGVVYTVSGIALGSLVLLFALQQSLVPALGLSFCVAAASQLFITMGSAINHTHTPDALRGRVMGLATVIVQGGISAGSLVVGLLGAAIGINAAMGVAGGAYAAISGAALARVAPLRKETVDRPPALVQARAAGRS